MSVCFLTDILSYDKVLVIEDLDEYSKVKFVLEDNEFTLGYIHSVLLTPAEEVFTVGRDNELLLQKTIYESFGVGLPYDREKYKFEIKDGKFILYVKRSFDSINMRISSIPKHWLQIGNAKYQLVDLIAKEEDLIKIYAKNTLIIKFGKRKLIL
ncbi:DUF1850 domain-containing protein [Clostridiaceae bacterium M8S5]|nr:DUF1850 domain-containing protein [Clostridiaceae bacterium M8S5]